jgi:hypothetical protein
MVENETMQTNMLNKMSEKEEPRRTRKETQATGGVPESGALQHPGLSRGCREGASSHRLIARTASFLRSALQHQHDPPPADKNGRLPGGGRARAGRCLRDVAERLVLRNGSELRGLHRHIG